MHFLLLFSFIYSLLVWACLAQVKKFPAHFIYEKNFSSSFLVLKPDQDALTPLLKRLYFLCQLQRAHVKSKELLLF